MCVLTSAKRDINVKACSHCGAKHAPRSCPAYVKQCNICGKSNHFAKVCRSSQPRLFAPSRTYQQTSKLSTAVYTNDTDCDEPIIDSLFTICIDTLSKKRDW